MEIIVYCRECDEYFGINRHTIEEYNFVHVDECIEGDYRVICPHCKTPHYLIFKAELTEFELRKA